LTIRTLPTARFNQPSNRIIDTPLLLDHLNILLAHSSDLMLTGLSAVLGPDMNTFSICGKFSNLGALLKHLSHTPTAEGLLILDDQLYSPLSMIHQIVAAAPRLKIILLSRWTSAIYIDAVFRAGVHSFLCTAEPLGDSLRNALQVVASGHRYLSPEASSHYVVRMTETQLVNREYPELQVWQALVLLINGSDVHQTAEQLGVKLIKVYRIHKRLRDWFGVNTNVELVRQAILFGFDVQK